MLKHLIINPECGLCNRLRIIYSGLSISSKYNARLTILFPKRDLSIRRLIELPKDVEIIVSEIPDLSGYKKIESYGGNRTIDCSKIEKLYCIGHSRFSDKSSPAFNIYQYARIIKPTQEVFNKAQALKEELNLPEQFVSLHIRRGDHKKSMSAVSNDMIINAIKNILIKNRKETILLACEDIELRTRLTEQFHPNITVVTKKTIPWSSLKGPEPETLLNDYAELILLSQGKYIIGSAHSSFSRMIISYNGPKRESFILGKGGLHV